MRQRMVHDLLDREILIGKTHGGLTTTLGRDYLLEFRGDWDRTYYLGSGSFSSVQSLAIRFGPDDRVAEVEILTFSD